jgi:hypothetical protein
MTVDAARQDDEITEITMYNALLRTAHKQLRLKTGPAWGVVIANVQYSLSWLF